MATAPSRRAAVAATTVTGTNPTSATVTIGAGDTVIGDLIVVMWTASAAIGSALSVPTCSYATFVQDATADDGTRNAYVWSGIVTSSPGGAAVTITLTLPTNSGTRRLMAFTVNPGTGQHWDSARKVRTITGTGTAGGNPWTASWSASTSVANPEFPVMAYVSAASTQTLDWGDGNGAVSDSYPNASAAAHVWALSNSITSGYSTNTLASTSTVSFGSQAASSKAYAGVLYAVADPIQGRGKTAGKGTGRFTIIRPSSARGKNASKGTGLGTVYTGVRTAEGRGNTASKATGAVRPKTATGVGRTAADSYTDSWTHTALAQARGKNASKATAGFLKRSVRSGRGNTASSGAATFTITRVATGSGPTASTGRANYQATHRATGLGPAANSGTGAPIRRIMRNGKGFSAAKATARFYVTVPCRELVVDQTTLVVTPGPTSTLTLGQSSHLTIDQTTTVTVDQDSTVLVPQE